MKMLIVMAAITALMITGCSDAPQETQVTNGSGPQKILVIVKPYPVEVCNSKISK